MGDQLKVKAGSALIAALTALVSLGFAFTSPASAVQTSKPLLTLSGAQRAFASTWHGFDSAWQSENLSELHRYSTPDMLLATVGSTDCGCGPWTEQQWSVDLSVPNQTEYPISFLAQVTVTRPAAHPFLEMVVLTRANPKANWLVAYLVDVQGHSSTWLTRSAVAAAPAPPFDTSVIGSQFAEFFESYANEGAPPSDGVAWPLEGATAQEVARYETVKQAIANQGDTQGPMSFGALSSSALFAYPGGDIVCGDLHASVHITAPANDPTVQPADRSVWGNPLAPGRYTSLEKQQLRDYCVTVSRQGRVTPISYFGGTYSISGTA
jgi:hypothetical protein